MTKPSITQSQKRYSESMGALFNRPIQKKHLLFLKSSSDIGVMRNGGRNGARFAPQSFISVFKRLSQNRPTSEYTLSEVEVASFDQEMQDFSLAQVEQSQRIRQQLEIFPGARICHLGGGHDHIYPLLKALSPSYQHIVVINIDAHADTRTDSDPHSGTPFRQFASEFSGRFELFQVGLNAFANSQSTLEELERGEMSILWREQLKQETAVKAFFQAIRSTVTPETLVVFSLDADALDGSEVPGVSAVNGQGLRLEELGEIWQRYHDLPLPHAPIIGIYELNPVFDSPSMLSMRRLAAFLYQTL